MSERAALVAALVLIGAVMPRVSKRELLDAISEGVPAAIWDVATNATMMPCHDFYAAVEDSVASGIERAHQGGTPR